MLQFSNRLFLWKITKAVYRKSCYYSQIYSVGTRLYLHLHLWLPFPSKKDCCLIFFACRCLHFIFHDSAYQGCYGLSYEYFLTEYRYRERQDAKTSLIALIIAPCLFHCPPPRFDGYKEQISAQEWWKVSHFIIHLLFVFHFNIQFWINILFILGKV